MTNAILIGVLAFAALACLAVALLVQRRHGRDVYRKRLATVLEPLPGQADKPRGTLQAVSKLGKMMSKPSSSLRQELAMAGLHGDAAAPVYMGAKFLLLFVGVAASVLLGTMVEIDWPFKVAATIVLAGILFFVPNMVVGSMLSKRQNEVREHLPDAIDLLEICVSSGMGMETAWNLVGDEFRQVSPVLADEITLTNLEIHLGVPRATAMRHMAARTGADELGSLVAILIQSERFGTSIAEALQVFASSMRETRSSRIEENAEKMAVKLLFPMILFIFPLVLVIVAGPALLRLMHAISTY